MSIATFIAKNALRNKRRALLSVMSVAVSLFLLVLLLVGLREMTTPMEDVSAASRIIVRSKISLATLLPARQRQTIEKIPGVAAITPFTWYGGAYKNESVMFAQFGVEPEALPIMMSDAKIPSDQLENFLKDRRACVLGKITADKYKLKVGDPMPLTGTFWPFNLDLRIAAIYEGTIDDRNLFFHHKYLDEQMKDPGSVVGTWWIKTETLDDVPQVVDAINKAFENSAAQVRAETERAFQRSFISMWGNVKLLVRSICSVVVFTLIVVSASTMSMAIRERFRELAVLKALGFKRMELFGFILAESFALSFLGGLIGLGGAYILFTYGDVAAMTNNIFLVFEVTPRILGLGFLVACLLGIVASIGPSIAVARMSVVQGLKTLD
ncbi:MAG: ABC transporter permease [Verrucomicrobiales bacterium]